MVKAVGKILWLSGREPLVSILSKVASWQEW